MRVKAQVSRAYKLCLKRELQAHDSADFESMLTLSQKEDFTNSLVVKREPSELRVDKTLMSAPLKLLGRVLSNGSGYRSHP